MTLDTCHECTKPVASCDCPASIRTTPAPWVLTMQGRLPMSMNERERAHYWRRHQELEQITTDLMWLAREQKIPPATTRRGVQVTIHKSTRSRVRDDPANRDSRAKSILDALTRLHLLKDDNDTWLDWHGVIEGDKHPIKHTVVAIWNTEAR